MLQLEDQLSMSKSSCFGPRVMCVHQNGPDLSAEMTRNVRVAHLAESRQDMKDQGPILQNNLAATYGWVDMSHNNTSWNEHQSEKG